MPCCVRRLRAAAEGHVGIRKMNLQTYILLLGLSLSYGCVTNRQLPISPDEQNAFRDICAVVDAHKEEIDRLIAPYVLRCTLFEEELTSGTIRFVSVSGRLPSGTPTNRRVHLHEPPVVEDTTTYQGRLRSLTHDEREKLGTHFEELERELSKRNFYVGAGSRYSVAVWLEHPGVATQDMANQ